MENYNIYEDIATRTQGALYIGVVGPVRWSFRSTALWQARRERISARWS